MSVIAWTSYFIVLVCRCQYWGVIEGTLSRIEKNDLRQPAEPARKGILQLLECLPESDVCRGLCLSAHVATVPRCYMRGDNPLLLQWLGSSVSHLSFITAYLLGLP